MEVALEAATVPGYLGWVNLPRQGFLVCEMGLKRPFPHNLPVGQSRRRAVLRTWDTAWIQSPGRRWRWATRLGGRPALGCTPLLPLWPSSGLDWGKQVTSDRPTPCPWGRGENSSFNLSFWHVLLMGSCVPGDSGASQVRKVGSCSQGTPVPWHPRRTSFLSFPRKGAWFTSWDSIWSPCGCKDALLSTVRTR